MVNIGQLRVELTLPSETDSATAMAMSEGIYQDYISESLRKVLEESEGRDLDIGYIEVDLGVIQKEDIPYVLERELRRVLDSIPLKPLRVSPVSVFERPKDRVLEYLSSGLISDAVQIVTGPTAPAGFPVIINETEINGSPMNEGTPTGATAVDAIESSQVETARSAESEEQPEKKGRTGSGPRMAVDPADLPYYCYPLEHGREFLSQLEEMLKEASSVDRMILAARQDRRSFYRLMDLLDDRQLSVFLLTALPLLPDRRDLLEHPQFQDLRPLLQKTSREQGSTGSTGSTGIAELTVTETKVPGDLVRSFLREALFTSPGTPPIAEVYPEEKENFLKGIADLADMPEGVARIHIDDAGLIILSPFLPRFFDRLSYLDEDGRFLSPDRQIRAVHLTRSLAFRDEDDRTEGQLTFSKILCGLSPLFPVVSPFSATEKEIQETESLLEAVIQYWTSLKNTTVGVMQRTFIQRHGTIEKDEEGWLLRVEGKAFDILMEDIPWGYSTFLPAWSKMTIFTEWQKEY